MHLEPFGCSRPAVLLEDMAVDAAVVVPYVARAVVVAAVVPAAPRCRSTFGSALDIVEDEELKDLIDEVDPTGNQNNDNNGNTSDTTQEDHEDSKEEKEA